MTINRERTTTATNYNYNYNYSYGAATRIGSETICIEWVYSLITFTLRNECLFGNN
jgi:hypothetical protein